MATSVLLPLARRIFCQNNYMAKLNPAAGETLNQMQFSVDNQVRYYRDRGCRRAVVDIPPPEDPECKLPCNRRMKKPGLLFKLKLKILEGGSNFGTPFKFLKCKKEKEPKPEKSEEEEPKSLPAPEVVKTVTQPETDIESGVTISVLGGDTSIGQYLALMLKQCPSVKRLKLYEARNPCCDDAQTPCTKNMYQVVRDLSCIDTNCILQAFSCSCDELELCLQNSDIVVILESAYVNPSMPFVRRFEYQAPIVKGYVDAIARECPKAIIVVCASPVDCMVPLVAETLKETGWYDPRKVIGSVAASEMRATTLVSRYLSLEPSYSRVPCVGGTEGEALVPLFSRAIEHFEFSRRQAEVMTQTVRCSPYCTSCCGNAELSEAYALANMVKAISHALLCQDVPRVSGFVETDASQILSPANFLSVDCLVNRHGICKKFDLPPLSDYEMELLDQLWGELVRRVNMGKCYFQQAHFQEYVEAGAQAQKNFLYAKHYHHVESCNVQSCL